MTSKIAIFSPSHYCNSKCWMCTDLWTDIKSYIEPNFDVVCEGLRELKGEGVTALHICGGEPTVWRGFDTFIEYAHSLAFEKIAVYSNGRTLTRRKVEHCLNNGVSLFLISLHAADSATGDIIANASKSFEQTLKGLQVLKECKAQYKFEVSISCVPSKLTETQIVEMASLALTFNIDSFHLSYPVNTSFVNPIQQNLFPDLKVMKSNLETVFKMLLKSGVHPVINEIPPCYYKPFTRYYSAAYPQSERILIGYHTKNGSVVKENYIPLESSQMNFHPHECASCYLLETCHGIPNVYRPQYVEGELSPFTEEEVKQLAGE